MNFKGMDGRESPVAITHMVSVQDVSEGWDDDSSVGKAETTQVFATDEANQVRQQPPAFGDDAACDDCRPEKRRRLVRHEGEEASDLAALKRIREQVTAITARIDLVMAALPLAAE